jgi:hypothetical protein
MATTPVRMSARHHHARGRGDTGQRRRRAGGLLTAVVGMVFTVAAAVPAVAAPPVVYDQGGFEDSYTVPAEAFPCGVEVTFHEDMTYRFTAFLDRDGEVVREMGHIGGTTTVTSAYGQITNRWRENAVLDPESGTISWTGNSFNIHAGAGGVLVNMSGRWIVDLATDDLTFVAGPHEDPDEDFSDLCAVLAP